MKLLFISQAARIIFDETGNAYLNNHMNRKTIQRFADCCNELTMFLRDSGECLSECDARERYNPFPYDLARLIVGYNPYNPLTNWMKISERIKLRNQMEQAICQADRVIFAATSGFYIDMGIQLCIRYHKPYMLMNGGFTLETIWSNKNPLGKVIAPLYEYHSKRNHRKAQWLLYVTEYALQKRYPCKGKTIGVSDVEVEDLRPEILERRIEKIKNPGHKFVFGTAAAIDDKRKGQKYVIRAMGKLKRAGLANIEYQLLGAGNPDKLLAEARRFDVIDQVKILGPKPHSDVYAWLDSIDIYIQPSFSEGLCRSIVEAMSRACPVLSSDAGGNVELCNREFLFKAGKVDQIVERILHIQDISVLEHAARENFVRAKKYEKNHLDALREAFLDEFMN